MPTTTSPSKAPSDRPAVPGTTVRTVIFDMNDVLVGSESVWLSLQPRFFAEYGLDVAPTSQISWWAIRHRNDSQHAPKMPTSPPESPPEAARFALALADLAYLAVHLPTTQVLVGTALQGAHCLAMVGVEVVRAVVQAEVLVYAVSLDISVA